MSPLATAAARDVEVESDIGHGRHEDPAAAVVRATVEHLDQHLRVVAVEEPEQPRLAGSPDSRSGLADSAFCGFVAHTHLVAAVENERRRRGTAVRVLPSRYCTLGDGLSFGALGRPLSRQGHNRGGQWLGCCRQRGHRGQQEQQGRSLHGSPP